METLQLQIQSQSPDGDGGSLPQKPNALYDICKCDDDSSDYDSDEDELGAMIYKSSETAKARARVAAAAARAEEGEKTSSKTTSADLNYLSPVVNACVHHPSNKEEKIVDTKQLIPKVKVLSRGEKMTMEDNLHHVVTPKKVKKFCSVIGCTNGLKSRGLCRKHRVNCRRCSWKGCTNVVVRDGVCSKHGKFCSVIGCTNGLKSRGLCRKHLVNCRRCSWKGCTNVVVRDGVCIKHGGGVFFIKHRAAQAPASNEAVCIKINNNTLSSVSTAQDSRVPVIMTYYHASKEESSQIYSTNVVQPSASKAYNDNGNGFINNNMPEEISQLYTAKAVPVLPKKSSVPLNTSNYSSTNINMRRSFQLYNTATEVVQQPSASGINNNNPTEAMLTNVVGGYRTNSIEQALTNAVESLTNADAVGYQEKMLNIALEQVKNQQESYYMQSLSHVLNGVSVSESSQFPFILYEMLEYKYSRSLSWAMDDESFYFDQKDKEYSLFVSSKSFPNTIFVLKDESVKLMYICSPSRFFFRLISSIIGTSVVWVYTMATHVGLTRILSVADPKDSSILKLNEIIR